MLTREIKNQIDRIRERAERRPRKKPSQENEP